MTHARSFSARGIASSPQNVSIMGDAGEYVSNIKDNALAGAESAAMAADIVIEAGNSIVTQQVYIETQLGLVIADILACNPQGELVGFEVKIGLSARRSTLQLQKDYSIATVGGTIISRGLGGVGFPYGGHVQFYTGVVSIFLRPLLW